MTAHGVPGCTCWADPKASDPTDVYWRINGACPYHGLLSRERADTGVYRVVTVCTRPAPHECRVNGPCNGLPKPEPWPMDETEDEIDAAMAEAEPVELVPPPPTTAQKERGEDPAGGIFATVRRWWRNRCWTQDWWF